MMQPEFLRRFRLNGRDRAVPAADHTLLVETLRETLGLVGTKQGCDGGECGACTVLIDGVARLACLTRTGECDGKEIETIEGLATGGRIVSCSEPFTNGSAPSAVIAYPA